MIVPKPAGRGAANRSSTAYGAEAPQAHDVPLAALALVLLGLGFAPVYPCLLHKVPRRFAPEAVLVVIGRQSGAAYLGAASLPALAGTLAQVSLEGIAWTLVGGIVLMLAVLRRLDRIT